MKILFATTEAVPFCKTGGLGDVCGSLPLELAKLGHEPVVVSARLSAGAQFGPADRATGVRFEVPIGRKTVAGTFLRSTLPGDKVPVYLVHQPQYYDRPELYRENGHDYKDNCERFVFFCRAALEAIQLLDLGTELVHCHDWTAGLIPAYLKTELCGVPPYDSIASLLTIHNIAYQGNFWHWDMELTGIDWKYFNWRQMEFYGNLSFLKTGLAFADTLSTVSPRYAQEIQRRRWAAGWKASCSTATTTCSASSTASITASGIRKSIRTWAATITASTNFRRGQAGLQGGAAARDGFAASRRCSRSWR